MSLPRCRTTWHSLSLCWVLMPASMILFWKPLRGEPGEYRVRKAGQGCGHSWFCASSVAQGILGALASAVMLLPLPVLGQEETILDLYRELQTAQPNGVPAYEITPDERGKNAVRILFPADPAARLEAEYDARLDYLRITRHETGKGANQTHSASAREVLEAALWLDAEGAPLLGLSERRLLGDVPESGRLRFFSRASGRWNAVTGNVAPALSSAICGKADGVVDDEAIEPNLPVAAFLPLQDTQISLWCLPQGLSSGRGVALVWNVEKSLFETSPLPAGPAPWAKGQAPQ